MEPRPGPTFELVERGDLSFFVRPRVQLETVNGFSDVQKLALVLQPAERPDFARSIHIGRKRMPDPAVREREWAYVDRAGSADAIVAGLTQSKTRMTKTRGLRRQGGAFVVASGTYGIVTHGAHVHLATHVTDCADDVTEMLLSALRIVPRASYIAAVFNPESKWRIRDHEMPEVPFGEPSIFDDVIMNRFGNRRFAPLSPDLVDHEGAELVLIGGCPSDASSVLVPNDGSPHRG